MKMFGGMLCLDLGGGYERAARFFDRLKIVKRAASLGGVESLCSLPVLTSQWGHSDEELERAGVTASMARLSIGLEDPKISWPTSRRLRRSPAATPTREPRPPLTTPTASRVRRRRRAPTAEATRTPSPRPLVYCR